jgi:hypothetical protein
MDVTTDQIIYYCMFGSVIMLSLWLVLIVTGMVFASRSFRSNAESARLSIGFAIASVFFPPLAVVPICLNARTTE